MKEISRLLFVVCGILTIVCYFYGRLDLMILNSTFCITNLMFALK